MPNDEDQLFKGYERDINAEMLELWNKCRITGDTTKTKIMAALKEIKQDTQGIPSFFQSVRNMFGGFVGDYDKRNPKK